MQAVWAIITYVRKLLKWKIRFYNKSNLLKAAYAEKRWHSPFKTTIVVRAMAIKSKVLLFYSTPFTDSQSTFPWKEFFRWYPWNRFWQKRPKNWSTDITQWSALENVLWEKMNAVRMKDIPYHQVLSNPNLTAITGINKRDALKLCI